MMLGFISLLVPIPFWMLSPLISERRMHKQSTTGILANSSYRRQ